MREPRMSETKSIASASEFPSIWYDQTTADHFWNTLRFRALLRQLDTIGEDLSADRKVLDIGCGNGVLQGQFCRASAWTVDGCELNEVAVESGQPERGRTFYYDIHERRADLREAYDTIILFDVIEHIAEPVPFIEAALWHLKPGGLVLVNVPALQGLYSQYDAVQNHYRRYTVQSLGTELAAAGLQRIDLRYWGMAFVPLLYLRKLMLSRHTDTDEIMRRGFKPPHPLFNRLLELVGKVEQSMMSRPPLGSSAMAAARKPVAKDVDLSG